MGSLDVHEVLPKAPGLMIARLDGGYLVSYGTDMTPIACRTQSEVVCLVSAFLSIAHPAGWHAVDMRDVACPIGARFTVSRVFGGAAGAFMLTIQRGPHIEATQCVRFLAMDVLLLAANWLGLGDPVMRSDPGTTSTSGETAPV